MDGESETFIAHTLRADGFDASEDGTGRGNVRRLTPRECEILMGFPPDYTLIPTVRKKQKETGAAAEALFAYLCRTESGRTAVEMRDGRVYSTPDGPRYRVLGNSMALPCIRWIVDRIRRVDAITERAA
jgi:DNA (cytosine-5)-methyltransferase 1